MSNGWGYGGFRSIPTESETVSIVPSLKDQFDKDMAVIDIQKIQAEQALEQSKKEYLETQMGISDPKKITPPYAVQSKPALSGTMLLILGAVAYFFMKKKGKLL